MNNKQQTLKLFLILIVFSLGIFILQTLVFHRVGDSVFYMLQDLAFMPFEIALVTFVFDRFLNAMEERKKIKKINVIITTFFIELGTAILKEMARFDLNHEETTNRIRTLRFTKNEEKPVLKAIESLPLQMYADPEKLPELAQLMMEKKAFLLSMLENSNLLEHDSFTDMLWAVFHVADELQVRKIEKLEQEDVAHLSNDLKRAYAALIKEWVHYLIYLEQEYPFLYSIAIRKTPYK